MTEMKENSIGFLRTFLWFSYKMSLQEQGQRKSDFHEVSHCLWICCPPASNPSLPCFLQNLPSFFKIQLKCPLLFCEITLEKWSHSLIPLSFQIFYTYHCCIHWAPHSNSFCIILSSHLVYELPNSVDELSLLVIPAPTTALGYGTNP